MNKVDKIDIEVTALAYTDPIRWESVLNLHKRREKLEAKEAIIDRRATAIIKKIKADPLYKKNYKKVKKVLIERVNPTSL